MSGTLITLVRVVLGHRERIKGLGPASPAKLPAGSITTSELELLMRNAVQDATAPLAERISRLEKSGAGIPSQSFERTSPATRPRIDELSEQEVADLSPEDDVIKTRLRVR